jgi:DUF971 family protein
MISNKKLSPQSVYTHERRKTLSIKFKDGNPSNKSTRQMRTQVKHNPKRKQEQPINQNENKIR